MERNSKHNLIKQVQTQLPRGAPFDLPALGGLGVSPQLAAQYVKGGWLIRLAQGVYAFPNDELDPLATLRFLQTRVPGLHVAGKSALALQGVRHNLSSRAPWLLWGDTRFTLPGWFTSRFLARYVSARLFEWPDDALAAKTLTTPPGTLNGLQVSVPERALLELLYEVGTHQGLEEARQLFESLRNPRKEVLARLLQCCTSVKAVRLCLTWARETNLLDVDALLSQSELPVGSDQRWMTRLKDGTLLSLRPHG
ncbi:MAG: hypothetical protein DI562_06770 [Stenotrophomonas acidaminiphila]|nr:MAG: hypothetical protein DI562_06770 [Stenotrophomonas acidaminiphila]